MKLLVCNLKECDPKKCTTVHMDRNDKIEVIYQMRNAPKGAVLLDPLSEKAFSPADKELVKENGLLAIDCSWKNVEFINSIRKDKNSRILPYLVAANPIHYGHPTILSTAESIAAALYILGYMEKAENILEGFKWGHTFFELNKEPLKAYSKARNSEDIIRIQEEFLPDNVIRG